jgi:hypothetical protein
MSGGTIVRAPSEGRRSRGTSLLTACAAGIVVAATARVAPAAFVTYQDHSQPTASFQAIASYIRNDKPTINFGRDVQILAGTVGGSTGRVRGVFAYDLRTAGALAPGSTITDVSFALTVAGADGVGSVSRNVTLEMHQLTGTITEGNGLSLPATTTSDVTWNNRTTAAPWTTAGGDISPTVLASVTADPTTVDGTTVLTFTGSGASNPLVQAAQAALDNPTSGVFEFVVKLPSGTLPGQEQGSSRELFIFQSDDNLNNGDSYDPSVAPTLRVTATPEPASAALLSALAAGLLLRRRRHR